jgi:hypothetical protein
VLSQLPARAPRRDRQPGRRENRPAA